MRRGRGILAIVGMALLLTGCGGSRKTYESAATDTAAYENGYGSDIYMAETTGATEVYPEEAYGNADEAGMTQAQEVQNTKRKLIKNVNLNVETESFEELLSNVESKTENVGGYIERSYTYNGSSYYGNERRNASLTIRVPAEKLDEFLSALAEVSNVISRNDSVTDVTLQYVDLESHKKMLQTEQERLLVLLEQAETIEDIITIESRLSEVRYQIESMEAQLRTYDNQVNYSTVYLEIEEVRKLTPVKEQTIGEKIVTGFTENLFDVGKGLLDFGIWIIVSIPHLAVWAVVIVVIVLIVRTVIRRRKKTKEKQEK